MRIFKRNFHLASLGTVLLAASCTLITDVDRTQIPTDTTGGTAGTNGGTAGTGGTSGSGSGGDAGDGSGGMPEGGSGGSSGSSGASGSGSSGEAGAGGAPSACAKATGTITLAPMTFLADGDTFTLGDGIHDAVVFEFDLNGGGLTDDERVGITFDGTEDHHGLAALIAAGINGVGDELWVTASYDDGSDDGAGGQGGQGGEGGSGTSGGGADNGAGNTGEAGAGGSGSEPPVLAVITLTNDAYGELGNVTITDRVGNNKFDPEGMSGGEAVACAEEPTLCDDDDACATSCDTDTNLCEAP